MADTIKLRRILNQACMDKGRCNDIICAYNINTCSYDGYINQPLNWWIEEGHGAIPCFLSSHNILNAPIHPQDPMK